MGNSLRNFEKREKQGTSSSGETKPSCIDFAAGKLPKRQQETQESSSEPFKDVTRKLGNEDVTFSHNADRQALDWLQGKNVPEEPQLDDLAYTVNPYKRIGSFGDGGQEWVNERLQDIRNDKGGTLKTQDLLDLLFYFHRKDRFCEGTLESLQKETSFIMTELHERVKKLRN